MKKLVSLALALVMVLSLCAIGAHAEDYTIRIYSNSNSPERMSWLTAAAKKAGFTIKVDDNTVYSGDSGAVQAANEGKDADIIFGLNETRWYQLVNGAYENLKVADWTPSWAAEVGNYKYDGKAYGLVVQNVLMLYRNDELGTNGEKLHFAHWADLVNSGYKWYRQGKVGGTTNTNINNAILYPFADPSSPAGGISIEGWKTLWKYCAEGNFTGDSYGLEPLIRGDVQVSTFYSSSLYGNIDSAFEAGTYDKPLEGTVNPVNWDLVEIDDGTFYIAEYIGVIEKEGRTEAQTEIVKAFAEWFGSAETQTAWAEEFDSFPCNEVAVANVYGEDIPNIYALKAFSTNEVEGAGVKYADYAVQHNAEWTNIMTNLGFYWKDNAAAPAEPDWDNINWALMTQKAE